MTAIQLRPLIQWSLSGLLLLPAWSWAQHPPLTGTMGTPSNTAAIQAASPPTQVIDAVPAPAPALRPAPAAFGDGTRSLLRMQADANQSGRALPMLGETASRSYQRYLNSFDHPIPVFFEATLPTNKGQGSSP